MNAAQLELLITQDGCRPPDPSNLCPGQPNDDVDACPPAIPTPESPISTLHAKFKFRDPGPRGARSSKWP
jgi:hypothetical protein